PGSPLRARYEQLAEAIREHMQGVMAQQCNALKQAV
ncbi:MAG: DNA-binding transcriptional regulator OxyR, partial [Enterobacterales bacterium]|nr:DNA-binding transcriptional regulator OxyR [Enterobacterales bacterium]